jgi:hypothetical protein
MTEAMANLAESVDTSLKNDEWLSARRRSGQSMALHCIALQQQQQQQHQHQHQHQHQEIDFDPSFPREIRSKCLPAGINTLSSEF